MTTSSFPLSPDYNFLFHTRKFQSVSQHHQHSPQTLPLARDHTTFRLVSLARGEALGSLARGEPVIMFLTSCDLGYAELQRARARCY